MIYLRTSRRTEIIAGCCDNFLNFAKSCSPSEICFHTGHNSQRSWICMKSQFEINKILSQWVTKQLSNHFESHLPLHCLALKEKVHALFPSKIMFGVLKRCSWYEDYRCDVITILVFWVSGYGLQFRRRGIKEKLYISKVVMKW